MNPFRTRIRQCQCNSERSPTLSYMKDKKYWETPNHIFTNQFSSWKMWRRNGVRFINPAFSKLYEPQVGIRFTGVGRTKRRRKRTKPAFETSNFLPPIYVWFQSASICHDVLLIEEAILRSESFFKFLSLSSMRVSLRAYFTFCFVCLFIFFVKILWSEVVFDFVVLCASFRRRRCWKKWNASICVSS